jgi:hypothetical protein
MPIIAIIAILNELLVATVVEKKTREYESKFADIREPP